MKLFVTLMSILTINGFTFANEFNCKITPVKVIDYIIGNSNFPNQETRNKLIIDYSRFYECVQSHDFWDAYDEFGFGDYGTAHGIYKKCSLQTSLPSSCINDEFFELILNSDRFTCISKLSHFVDNEYGARSKQYLYLGNEFGSAQLLGHSDLFYINKNIKCESNHFRNCKLAPAISNQCISKYSN